MDSDWTTLACVPDSNIGTGLWQLTPLCTADGCGTEGEYRRHYCQANWSLHSKTTGVLSSPNRPGNYPDFFAKTETIQVKEGLVILLQFTAFNIEPHSNCGLDNLTITDWDGTTLMNNSCGYSDQPSWSTYFQPPIITTRSNRVEIFFHTDGSGKDTGWSLSWSAVTPGEKALMLNSSRFFHPFDLNF